MAAVVLFTACGGPPTAPPPTPTPTPYVQAVDDYLRIYGGLAGVYRSILGETDCDELQELFYTATDNGSTGYQAAIIDRGQAIGCPEFRFTRP